MWFCGIVRIVCPRRIISRLVAVFCRLPRRIMLFRRERSSHAVTRQAKSYVAAVFPSRWNGAKADLQPSRNRPVSTGQGRGRALSSSTARWAMPYYSFFSLFQQLREFCMNMPVGFLLLLISSAQTASIALPAQKRKLPRSR